VYGEEWRDILFKKWSFFNCVDIMDSHVYLVVDVQPSVWKTRIYDTEEEATKELRKVIKARCEEALKRTNWTSPQTFTRWARSLENDLNV